MASCYQIPSFVSFQVNLVGSVPRLLVTAKATFGNLNPVFVLMDDINLNFATPGAATEEWLQVSTIEQGFKKLELGM